MRRDIRVAPATSPERGATETMVPQNSERIHSLSALSDQVINLITKRQVALNVDPKHVHRGHSCDTIKRRGKCLAIDARSMKNHLLSFVCIKLEIIGTSQSEMCRNSSGLVDEFIEGTIRYESSAYLSKALPVCRARKSEAQNDNIGYRTNARTLYNTGIDPSLS